MWLWRFGHRRIDWEGGVNWTSAAVQLTCWNTASMAPFRGPVARRVMEADTAQLWPEGYTKQSEGRERAPAVARRVASGMLLALDFLTVVYLFRRGNGKGRAHVVWFLQLV